jgi:DNA transposition AAA+ family ATPase
MSTINQTNDRRVLYTRRSLERNPKTKRNEIPTMQSTTTGNASANHEDGRIVPEADNPAIARFFQGPSASQVQMVLAYCKAQGTMGLVAGGPGVGKTTTAKNFAARYQETRYFAAHPSASTVYQALRGLATVLGIACRSGQSSFDLWGEICRQLVGEAILVIIDEAQHLKIAALEAVRSIHDETGVGLVLMGDLDLHRHIVLRPQLHSRVSARCQITAPVDRDADCLAKAWNVESNATILTLLQRIARKSGGLRLANQVIRYATMLAKGVPSVEHVRKSIQVLGIEEASS